MVCNALTHSTTEDCRSEVMQIIPSYRIAYSISFFWLHCFNIQDEQELKLFGVLYDYCLHDFKSTTYCEKYFLYIKNAILFWISSNILNFLVKDEMDLSKWNKCILNSECITVTTLPLTYLKEKHSFGNIYLQFRENLTHWLTEYSNTNLFFMPGAGIPWIRLCLVFIKVYPSAWENTLQPKCLTEPTLQEKNWFGCSVATHNK